MHVFVILWKKFRRTDRGSPLPGGPASTPPAEELVENVHVAGVIHVALHLQGLRYRPVRPNRQGPVSVYRTGLDRPNRSKSVEVKFEFKILCVNGSYWYTGRFDRFTGRFDW